MKVEDIKAIAEIVEQKRDAEEDLEKILFLIFANESVSISEHVLCIKELKTDTGKTIVNKLLVLFEKE